MMTLVIAAAAAAVQPAPQAPSSATRPLHAQHERGQPAGQKDMDCCKDCCKDMAKKHEGRTGQ